MVAKSSTDALLRPCALSIDERGRLRVAEVCAEASRRGITPGMAIDQAKALAADLVVVPLDRERLARVALEVTTALLEGSPRVAWERGSVGTWERSRNEGVWWVDAAGLGEETRLVQNLLRIAKRFDFGLVRIGVADAAIAAYAATYRSPIDRSPHRLTVMVPSGRDAAFLAPYPLSLLELDEDLADTFKALGLTTLGHIARLDGDEVEARFGPEGLAAWRLARGIDRRGPATPRDDAVPVISCDLGDPVSSAEPLLFVLKGSLSSLGTALREKGRAAREVVVALTLDDGSRAERSVRPARPTSHEGALFDHCRALFDDWQLEEPVTGIEVRVTDTAPAAGEQGSLLDPRWVDPAALEAAFDRIRGREGGDAVAIPEIRDGHLPADAGNWTHRRTDAQTHSKVRESTVRPCVSASVRHSALRLLATPVPVRVRIDRSGLEAVRFQETWHDIGGWSGPERLAPMWWRTKGAVRDYFVARAKDGALWLLFRSKRAWFVEGFWD